MPVMCNKSNAMNLYWELDSVPQLGSTGAASEDDQQYLD